MKEAEATEEVTQEAPERELGDAVEDTAEDAIEKPWLVPCVVNGTVVSVQATEDGFDVKVQLAHGQLGPEELSCLCKACSKKSTADPEYFIVSFVPRPKAQAVFAFDDDNSSKDADGEG